MRKFSVVHISDLHIREGEENSFNRVRENVVIDLKEMIARENFEIDAIVMTGDVVDKGGSEKAYQKANVLFDCIANELDLDPKKIIIVPGNHDIPRVDLISNFFQGDKYDEFLDVNKFKSNWSVLKTRFDMFNKFNDKYSGSTERINGEFGGSLTTIKKQWGDVRFVMMNSAWATTGSTDYEHLMIGRVQLEELVEKNKSLPKPSLTIGLVHHPIDWFYKKEQKMINEFITNDNMVRLDVLMHGHIHNGQIGLSASPDGGILSLVSGVGYPNITDESKEKDFSHCRYAIYEFDIDKNLINITLRVSRENGEFVADTMLYSLGKENGRFSIPLIQSSNSNSETNTYTQVVKKGVEVDPVPLSDIVGRSNEISTLLDKRLRAAAITSGIGGQGKTVLAAEFLRRYSRGDDARFEIGVWVDCRELPDSLHSKIIQVLDALSGGKESEVMYREEKLEDTIKRLSKHLMNNKILIVFDNVDAYVNSDLEVAHSELHSVLDMILNSENESLVLITCRPPINDTRISFRHIQLSGLGETEGVDFFKKRGIEIKNSTEERYCKKLVELTKGHPWWLGLIAGQINSGHDTFKGCVEKFSTGLITAPGRIKDYFWGVWKQLNQNRQDLLRYLVEAARPLDAEEIVLAVQSGPAKINQDLRRLVRLGLLELHEVSTTNNVYQVHPLVREYVHESYTPEEQRHFVHRVLCVFMPPALVKLLFQNYETHDKIQSYKVTPRNLIESIETCLNSRNDVQALSLMERLFSTLINNGYHHQFQSLGLRVLDEIDWVKEGILLRFSGMYLVSSIINLLFQGNRRDKERGGRYLQRYLNSLEPTGNPYYSYLSIKARCSWLEGEYSEALNLCNEFDMVTKDVTEGKWEPWVVNNTRALSLRDSGEIEKALQLFISTVNEQDATFLGNVASCLMKLERYDESEELLLRSLNILLQETTYLSSTNLGFAYLWLAEIFLSQKKYYESKAFLSLAHEVWAEFAPGLLNKVEDLGQSVELAFGSDHISINFEEAKEVEKVYLEKINNFNCFDFSKLAKIV